MSRRHSQVHTQWWQAGGMRDGRGYGLADQLALGAVTLGIAFCLLLVAIQLHVWDGLPAGRLPYVPDSWYDEYEGVYDRFGARWGLSPYYFWGRFVFVVYLAGLAGAWALPQGRSTLARVGRRLLLVGFSVGLVGDVLAYWGGTGDELTTLTGIGFALIESPAMLLMTVAMVIYGLGLVRDGAAPRWSPWCLVVGGVLAPPIGFLVITYVPHGVLISIMGGIALALAGFRARQDEAEGVA
jgi:hypothetical protein